jgi:hypothetical protein
MKATSNSGMLSIVAAADIEPHRLVKHDANELLVLNGAGETPQFVAGDYGGATGDAVGVQPWQNAAEFVGVGSKAIAKGVAVYAAANGKISDAVSGASLGVSLTDCSGDGGLLTVRRA